LPYYSGMPSYKKPEDLIEDCDFYGALKVADFGAGSGSFTIPIAKKLKQGQLYAFDIQEPPMERIRSQAQDLGLTNIETVRADLEKTHGSHIKDESMDWVIIANILFQATNKKAVLSEAYRILKRGGKILFIEWKDGDSSILGPRTEHRITKHQLKEYVFSLKCSVEKEFELADHHYGLICKKG
jgi:ubiquinone/menaquinone biosynthesis C-methylase UbiE